MQSADVTATFCATLVDEWMRLGVSIAVVAPGSRSTPMALALASAPGWRVHIFHDERSASFAALGAAKAIGTPVLLLCTSGTAAVNFHPAVVEASHSEVPLIVLTADRPPELQGVGAPQTIDQKNLFGSASRSYIDAGVADDERRENWRSLAQRAYYSSLSDQPGPVHVNLPFREPLVGSPGTLPSTSGADARSERKRKPVGTEMLAKLVGRLSGRRGVIVAGSRGASVAALLELSRALGWPILAEPTSGCRVDEMAAIRHADAWLRDPALAAHMQPQSILRFGTLPASKVVNTWMRESNAEVTTISSSPFLIDPDRTTSLHLVTPADQLCVDLTSVVTPCGPAWISDWTAAEHAAREVLAKLLDNEDKLSEPGVARCMAAMLPGDSQLVVSSSMPIRDLEWYAGDCNRVTVLANRGANGIDGVVSTAVGAALATSRTTGLLIGDVAFLHDSNGLIGLGDRGVDVRMVVVDNRGGGIFSFLPQRSVLSTDHFEKFFGTPHSSNLALLAEAHGLRVTTVGSRQQLCDAISSRGPSVTIVQTDRDDNVERHNDIHRSVIAEVRKALKVG